MKVLYFIHMYLQKRKPYAVALKRIYFKIEFVV